MKPAGRALAELDIESLKQRIAKIPSREDKSVGLTEKEPDYFCSTCKDETGYLSTQDGYEVWVRCGCIERRKVERLMKSSEITEEFRKLGFSNFITEDKPDLIVGAYECALAYYQGFDEIRNDRRNSIALLGQPGAGKTHLLMAISNNLIQKKHLQVLYFPYVEGFDDLRDDFEALETKLERMKKADVLFIDDLFKPVKGVPRASEWQVEKLYAVVNYRYLNHLPILVSSELNADLIADIDEALGTRIYEMCKDYTVIIEGDRKLLNHRLGA